MNDEEQRLKAAARRARRLAGGLTDSSAAAALVAYAIECEMTAGGIVTSEPAVASSSEP